MFLAEDRWSLSSFPSPAILSEIEGIQCSAHKYTTVADRAEGVRELLKASGIDEILTVARTQRIRVGDWVALSCF